MSERKVLIIEDEELARNILKKYISKYHDFNLVEECTNGFEGLKAIHDHKPDLVFLDIQMPKLTGFEMLEVLDFIPDIIFTTAYDEFAIKAFEYNAIDYLLKPFSQKRFDKAISRALERLEQPFEEKPVKKLIEHVRDSEETLNRVVVKDNTKIQIVPVDEITYIEAQDDYVMIYTQNGRFLKQSTMKYFENHLDNSEFIRIHRAYIVRIDQISRIEPFEKESYVVILRNETQLRASRSGYKRLKEVLKI